MNPPSNSAALAAPPAPLRLCTFRLSHFSEKIRWTLDASGVPYVEVPWTPFFHILPAIWRGGKTTVPILEAGHQRIQDSTRILHWLEANRAPFTLLPSATTAPNERAATLATEDRFDTVGAHVVRYLYSEVLADRESVVRYWTLDASPRQARGIRRDYPVLRWIFQRKLGMRAATVARSRTVIDEGLAWLDKELATGRRYLVGDTLTVADITAAALLAPLACPDEHPIYGSARYRAGSKSLTAAWEGRPSFTWVREMYRQHRGPWADFTRIREALA